MDSLLRERTEIDDEDASEEGVVITPDGNGCCPPLPSDGASLHPRRAGLERVPFWVLSLGAYAVLGLVSLFVARRRLWVPRARLP